MEGISDTHVYTRLIRGRTSRLIGGQLLFHSRKHDHMLLPSSYLVRIRIRLEYVHACTVVFLVWLLRRGSDGEHIPVKLLLARNLAAFASPSAAEFYFTPFPASGASMRYLSRSKATSIAPLLPSWSSGPKGGGFGCVGGDFSTLSSPGVRRFRIQSVRISMAYGARGGRFSRSVWFTVVFEAFGEVS